MNRLLGFALFGAIGGLLLSGARAQASCLVNSTSGPLTQYAGRAIDVLNSPLSSADLRSSGDCLLTRDSRTGLEWLDLTATFGQGYGAVNSDYVTKDGFRLAMGGELTTLFQNAVVQARITNEPGATDRPVPVGTIGEISLLTAALGSSVTSNTPLGIAFTAYGVYGTPRVSTVRDSPFAPIDPNNREISLGSYFLAQTFREPVPPFQTATDTSLGGVINTRDVVVRDVSGQGTPVGAFLVRSSNVQAVPSPSLLPGMFGLMVAMRKRLKAGALKPETLKPETLKPEALKSDS
jgi:hypothetical protein